MTTLVALRQLEVEGKLFHHAAEIVPGLLAQETIDKLLDQRMIAEYPERRSLYRLLSAFSGVKDREELDKHEQAVYALPS